MSVNGASPSKWWIVYSEMASLVMGQASASVLLKGENGETVTSFFTEKQLAAKFIEGRSDANDLRILPIEHTQLRAVCSLLTKDLGVTHYVVNHEHGRQLFRDCRTAEEFIKWLFDDQDSTAS